MRMKKIDQINQLKYHLSNLKVVNYHIIFDHLLYRPMMEVKNQKESILLNFFLQSHHCRYLPLFVHKIAIPNSNSIKSHQISAIVSL